MCHRTDLQGHCIFREPSGVGTVDPIVVAVEIQIRSSGLDVIHDGGLNDEEGASEVCIVGVPHPCFGPHTTAVGTEVVRILKIEITKSVGYRTDDAPMVEAGAVFIAEVVGFARAEGVGVLHGELDLSFVKVHIVQHSCGSVSGNIIEWLLGSLGGFGSCRSRNRIRGT